jgi:hypothetical protein
MIFLPDVAQFIFSKSSADTLPPRSTFFQGLPHIVASIPQALQALKLMFHFLFLQKAVMTKES